MHSLTLPFTLLLTSLVATNAQDDAPRRPNIVWILTDDMHPYIKHHVSDQHPIAGKTPNLAALQDNGVTMTNTHCSQTTCGPSRASFLSGRYPDTLKIWNFDKYLPEVHPGIVTIPKYFKNLGYDVQTFGKVFHPHMINGNDVYESLGHYDEDILQNDRTANTECKWGALYCWGKSERFYTDYKIHRTFHAWLNRRKQSTTPFMAIIGLRRPHVALSSPRSAYAQVDTQSVRDGLEQLNRGIDNIEGVENADASLAKYTCRKMDSKKVEWGSGTMGRKPKKKAFTSVVDVDRLALPEVGDEALVAIRRSYFAAIVWIDEIVGKITTSLARSTRVTDDNTIVIFSSDHGLQNGEHGLFCKNTLFETTTKVPMILKGAGIPRNKQYHHPVQLVDLFPTLIDLVDGPALDDPSGLGLDGQSFKPQLDVLGAGTPEEDLAPHIYASYTVYPRCAPHTHTEQYHPCTTAQTKFEDGDCGRPQIYHMGYTMRTRTHRYTEWRDFHEERLLCESPSWEGMPAGMQDAQGEKYTKWGDASGTNWSTDPIQRELYVYDGVVDNLNVETHNLAYEPTASDAELMVAFSNMIRLKFTEAVPPCSDHGLLIDGACECLQGWGGGNCASTT